jgi:DNA repair protein RadA/Sms
MVVLGEVGLSGELRPVAQLDKRLREAAKLGFASAIVPKANAPRGAAAKAFEGLQIHPVERIEEAIDLVRRL